jgi:hypothetical protein
MKFLMFIFVVVIPMFSFGADAPPPIVRSWLSTNLSYGTFLEGQVPTWNATMRKWTNSLPSGTGLASGNAGATNATKIGIFDDVLTGTNRFRTVEAGSGLNATNQGTNAIFAFANYGTANSGAIPFMFGGSGRFAYDDPVFVYDFVTKYMTNQGIQVYQDNSVNASRGNFTNVTLYSATASRAAVIDANNHLTNAAGTPDGTKFLRDDNTYAVPPGTGAGLTTNANQFLGVPLSLKNGLIITNPFWWGTMTQAVNGGAYSMALWNPILARNAGFEIDDSNLVDRIDFSAVGPIRFYGTNGQAAVKVDKDGQLQALFGASITQTNIITDTVRPTLQFSNAASLPFDIFSDSLGVLNFYSYDAGQKIAYMDANAVNAQGFYLYQKLNQLGVPALTVDGSDTNKMNIAASSYFHALSLDVGGTEKVYISTNGVKLPDLQPTRILMTGAGKDITNAPAMTAGQYLTSDGSSIVASNLPASSGGSTQLVALAVGALTGTNGGFGGAFPDASGGIGLKVFGGILSSNPITTLYKTFTNGQLTINGTNFVGASNTASLVLRTKDPTPTNTVQGVSMDFAGSTFLTGTGGTNLFQPAMRIYVVPTAGSSAQTMVIMSSTNYMFTNGAWQGVGPWTTNMTVTSGGLLTLGSSSISSSSIFSGGDVNIAANSPLHWVNRINVYSTTADTIKFSDSSAVTFAGIFLGASAQSNAFLQFIPSSIGTSNSTLNVRSGNTNSFLNLGVGSLDLAGTNYGSGFTAPQSANSMMGAQLWSDGTNLCVVLQNSAGTRTTNKVTVTSWP